MENKWIEVLDRLPNIIINSRPYVCLDDSKFVVNQVLSEKEGGNLKPAEQILGYLDRMILEKEWPENDPALVLLQDLRNYITLEI